MNVRASLRFLRMSPRKVRLVADLLRGLPATTAERQLQFNAKWASRPLLKLLRSAMANATANHSLNRDTLMVTKITVDQGPTLKRYRPRAFGSASPIRKRTSHVTIILTSPDAPVNSKAKTAVPAAAPTDRSAKAKPAASSTRKKKE